MPHAWHINHSFTFGEGQFNQVSMSQETQSATPLKLLDPIEDVIQAISQGPVSYTHLTLPTTPYV